MAMVFSDPQRRVISGAIEELQRLDTDELTQQRAQLIDDLPPPYSQSGETTQLPSPEEARPADPTYARYLRLERRAKSTPRGQFRRLAKLEYERLDTQFWAGRRGRRLTLPVDKTVDSKANAENNIRKSWVDEGIWATEWGPDWPEGSTPIDADWLYNGQSCPDRYPFYDTVYGRRWGHEEKRPEDDLQPQPEPEPEPEPGSEPGNLFQTYATELQRPKAVPSRNQSNPQWNGDAAKIEELPVHLRYQEVYSPPVNVKHPEASQPLPRFLHEISREHEWIRDETLFERPSGFVDIEELAYYAVKKQWMDAGIWRTEWADMPGEKWLHEETDIENQALSLVTSPRTDRESYDATQETGPSSHASYDHHTTEATVTVNHDVNITEDARKQNQHSSLFPVARIQLSRTRSMEVINQIHGVEATPSSEAEKRSSKGHPATIANSIQEPPGAQPILELAGENKKRKHQQGRGDALNEGKQVKRRRAGNDADSIPLNGAPARSSEQYAPQSKDLNKSHHKLFDSKGNGERPITQPSASRNLGRKRSQIPKSSRLKEQPKKTKKAKSTAVLLRRSERIAGKKIKNQIIE